MLLEGVNNDGGMVATANLVTREEEIEGDKVDDKDLLNIALGEV